MCLHQLTTVATDWTRNKNLRFVPRFHTIELSHPLPITSQPPTPEYKDPVKEI